MSLPEVSSEVARVLEGPSRVGSERRWIVETSAGNRAVFASLLPELASDDAVRRRYIRDVQRRAELDDPGVARVLRRGEGDAAWRLRAEPPGESLYAWIQRRAPAPVADVSALGIQLAELLSRLHGKGLVVRDLNPRVIVLSEAGPVLTDVGLARVDVLSTRTAASLVLEGSPYASPEQLRKTTVDVRCDLYSLGVILWQMLTCDLPHGDGLAILRSDDETPSLMAARGDVPKALATIVERCIDGDPERRPSTAGDVKTALGGGTLPALIEKTVCQSCGVQLRLGQRLCTACGKLAVVYKRAPNEDHSFRVDLVKVKESAEQLAALRRELEPMSVGPLPPLNFIVGDGRMYSKEERSRMIKLPRALFTGLDEASATAIAQRLTAAGLSTRTRDRSPRIPVQAKIILAVAGLISGVAVGLAISPVVGVVLGSMLALGIFLLFRSQSKAKRHTPLLRLRPGPVALPASDPLVARLAKLVTSESPVDVRERVGELALAVQNLVDRRAKLLDAAERADVDAVTEPLKPLVTLLEEQISRIGVIDTELATLDEGALVRGLAAAKARGATETERDALLEGLDRLRALEEQRSGTLHRLLEATSLIRRSVELGLEVGEVSASAAEILRGPAALPPARQPG